MFRIVSEPIAAPLLPPDQAVGGVVVFEGLVRDLNDGKAVQALEYECFEELAVKEGEKIITEALLRFPILAAACVHRVGLLQLGDAAIRVEVAAGHRREAFEACEFVVDEVKRRVPVWKKEHYTKGPTDWLNASGQMVVTPESLFQRQMRLAEVGKEGQERLAQTGVAVIGAGGLGCPAIQYLAASGIGRLLIVDPDAVDVTNLHRQPLYRHSDVGRPKARLAAERARNQNPFCQVESRHDRLNEGNAHELLEGYDLVLDCTDNFKTKFLLNDLCLRRGKTLIHASIHQYEGQLMVVRPGGPCLRCLWPQPPLDGCVGTCAEDGVLGFVPGVFGTLQAAEAIKLALGIPSLEGELAVLSLRDFDLHRLRLPRAEDCLCGGGAAQATPEPLIARELLPGDILVDIREPHEPDYPVTGSIPMPMSRFDPSDPRLTAAARVVLVCEHGVRSRYLAGALQEEGFGQFVSWWAGRTEL